jgi:predicted transcriptional regulator
MTAAIWGYPQLLLPQDVPPLNALSNLRTVSLTVQSARKGSIMASMDQIVDRVGFMAAVQKGIDDIERGDTIPHAEVRKRLAAWLTE